MTDTTTATAGSTGPTTATGTTTTAATTAAATPAYPGAQPAIAGLTTMLQAATALGVNSLTGNFMVADPTGAPSYAAVTLAHPATVPAPGAAKGSIADILASLGTAITDGAPTFAESMVVEDGNICQVALTRC